MCVQHHHFSNNFRTKKKEFDFGGKQIHQEWQEFLAQNSKQQEKWDNTAP